MIQSLAREEYDFSGVADEELESCLYYEYFRESKAIIGEVNKIRKQIGALVNEQNLKVGDKISAKVTYTKATGHPAAMIEPVIIALLASTPEFPLRPWQSLSKDAKRIMNDFYGRAFRTNREKLAQEKPPLQIGAFDPRLGTITLNDWKIRKLPKIYAGMDRQALERSIASGFFQINLSYRNEQLASAFRAWLDKIRPHPPEPVKERRGRNNQRDALNWLGALRLRFHCRRLRDAEELIQPLMDTPNAMYYSDRKGWNRACESAVKHFRRLLIVNEGLPIHYTKGWQK
jgi:hypothetical protein